MYYTYLTYNLWFLTIHPQIKFYELYKEKSRLRSTGRTCHIFIGSFVSLSVLFSTNLMVTVRLPISHSLHFATNSKTLIPKVRIRFALLILRQCFFALSMIFDVFSIISSRILRFMLLFWSSRFGCHFKICWIQSSFYRFLLLFFPVLFVFG